jgi:hypothetical protein
MLQTAKESMVNRANSLEIYGKMQEVFIQMDSKQNVSLSVFVTKTKLVHTLSSNFPFICYPYHINFVANDIAEVARLTSRLK